MNCTNHVEMNGVATNLERLSNISQLNVLKASHERVVAFRMKEYSSTVLILCGCLWITSELDISGQKCDFCTHINKVVTVPLNHSKMLVLEWFIE